jgi:HrpA-like RNA helicase
VIHIAANNEETDSVFTVQMSATMDTKLFGTFFHGAPIVNVPGRTFPVSTFYLEDLLDQTNHMIEEGSRYARRDFSGRETATMWVTSRGGEKRRETADYQINEDVSDAFPGYRLATRK